MFKTGNFSSLDWSKLEKLPVLNIYFHGTTFLIAPASTVPKIAKKLQKTRLSNTNSTGLHKNPQEFLRIHWTPGDSLWVLKISLNTKISNVTKKGNYLKKKLS